MAFSLSRNAKLYVSTTTGEGTTANPTFSDANTWQIEVLDGFSFPANTSIQEVTVSEAGTDPIRGSQAFTTSIDPVDWSFSSYVRPYNPATTTIAPELIMWQAMTTPRAVAGAAPFALGAAGTGVSVGDGVTEINFDVSNKNQITQLQMYYNLGGDQWYHIEDAVVGSAEFDFGIDQISMIAWSGQARVVNKITDDTGTVTLSNLQTMANIANHTEVPTGASAPNFLQNKLTTVELMDYSDVIDSDTSATVSGTTLTASGGTPFASATIGDVVVFTGGAGIDTNIGSAKIVGVTSDTIVELEIAPGDSAGDVDYTVYAGYDIALTGGSLSVTNNITYLTPESLGVLNTPIEHFTGTRAVSGSMSVYLKTGATDSGTADLFKKISEDFTTITQNFRAVFHVGGPAPVRIDFEIPHCHLVVPVIDIQDVISLNIDFNGLPHDGTNYDLEQTNELIVNYIAP